MPTCAQSALDWLQAHATRATLEGMARYGIPADHALGVTMADMKRLGKQLGRDHALAAALWATGVYEARMVAAFADDPAQVTAAQMLAMALKGIGKRNAVLRKAAQQTARRLSASPDASSKWIGKDAVKELV
ncbi:MAG: hypothetical protein EOO25_08335 [Comamonadaceae bacterium]|nr:MAG: hypothetical protein EOO25_08335 [Comamonadaceae bacterium]